MAKVCALAIAVLANPSVSGSSGLENQYVIDGVNITNGGYGALGSYSIVFGSLGNGTPYDFIEEVQVKTAGYGAEFGQATGGVINVVTRSGSNQLKGSAFAYTRPRHLESAYNTVTTIEGTVNAAASTAAAPARPSRPPRFKAIAFDYFVLFDPDSVVADVDRVFPGKGRELTNLWRTRQFEYAWLRSITNRYVDFFAITEDALVYAVKAMKLELTPEKKRQLLDAYLHLAPWADTASALRTLKAAGVRIVTLANFSPMMLRSNAERAGVIDLFDALISTDANRTYKPDPRSYRLGMDQLHLRRQDILFVAFGGWDAAGAKAFGYPTFWVNRFNQPLEELDIRPDQTSLNLKALVDYVLGDQPPRASNRPCVSIVNPRADQPGRRDAGECQQNDRDEVPEHVMGRASLAHTNCAPSAPREKLARPVNPPVARPCIGAAWRTDRTSRMAGPREAAPMSRTHQGCGVTCRMPGGDSVAAPINMAPHARHTDTGNARMWREGSSPGTLMSSATIAAPIAMIVVGALLGGVWSPCVGPTLGAALGLAAGTDTLARAAAIMAAFGLGSAALLLAAGYPSRAVIGHRLRLLQAGQTGRVVFGIILLLVGVSVTSGLDKIVEGALVARLPQWWIDLLAGA